MFVSNRQFSGRGSVGGHSFRNRPIARWFALTAITVCVVQITGCATTTPSKSLPRDEAAYQLFPAPTDGELSDYVVGPLDVLSVTVFQEPDLSLKEIQVDASGNLSFPLIGDVRADGKTVNALSNEIAARLNTRYLRDAQVSVAVTSSVSQHITIEGSVTQPGVYEITGRQTLLQSIAQAKSPTRTARLDEVVVFRYVDGKRMGGVFNLQAIREGKALDPALRGGDIVVVGFSAVKGAFRDILASAPVLGLFRYF